jgi:hypothetical protein
MVWMKVRDRHSGRKSSLYAKAKEKTKQTSNEWLAGLIYQTSFRQKITKGIQSTAVIHWPRFESI